MATPARHQPPQPDGSDGAKEAKESDGEDNPFSFSAFLKKAPPAGPPPPVKVSHLARPGPPPLCY